MNHITDRLAENRQIELAKQILESHGYTVSKSNSVDIEKVNRILDEYSYVMEKLK